MHPCIHIGFRGQHVHASESGRAGLEVLSMASCSTARVVANDLTPTGAQKTPKLGALINKDVGWFMLVFLVFLIWD